MANNDYTINVGSSSAPNSGESMSQDKEQNLLAEAKKRFNYEVELDSHNRRDALEDLQFEIGLNQWDQETKAQREQDGQVSLQMNQLPKYVNQIVGEMRQNDIRITVLPADSDADVEIANIREGKISDIEYESNAEMIRDQGARSMVSCGYGAWRVLTKYSDESIENAFQQEVFVRGIENPFTVYMDSGASDRYYKDADYGFVIDTMTTEAFKEKYPDVNTIGIGSSGSSGFNAIGIGENTTASVAIAEYFYAEYDKEKVVLLSDGQSLPYKEAQQRIAEMQQLFDEAKAKDPAGTDESKMLKIVQTREIAKRKIKWCKMTDNAILEHGDWSGSYIPIILVYGYVTNINGKRYISGMVRNAKDAQRAYNYWHTAGTETIALSPKAPFMGTSKMIEGYEQDYLSANTRNLPMLKYNHDPNFPGMMPTRVPPPTPPIALFAQMDRADQNIKSCIGMFNSDVGDSGPELSGVAIQARQTPGDISNYIFIDNWQKAIEHEGVIINDLLDKIYVEDRDAKVRGLDGSETFAPINTTVGRAMERIEKNPSRYQGMNVDKLKREAAEKGEHSRFNDIGEGKYNVKISTGPAYQTQRQEAADAIAKITMASGQMPPLDKYFLLKTLDIPEAQEWADAVRKQIPQGILPPKPGEEPPKPQPPSPQEQFAMQMQQMDKQIKMMELQIQQQKMVTEQSKQVTEQDRRQTEQIQQTKETIKAYGELQQNDLSGKERMLKIINLQLSQIQQSEQNEAQRVTQ